MQFLVGTGILTDDSSESSDDDNDNDRLSVPVPIDTTHSPVEVVSGMVLTAMLYHCNIVRYIDPVDLESSSSSVSQVTCSSVSQVTSVAVVVEVQGGVLPPGYGSNPLLQQVTSGMVSSEECH